MKTPLNDLAKDWLYGKSDLIGIEIGSLSGESAEIFLKSNAFKTFYCIDPWFDYWKTEDYIRAEKNFDNRFSNNSIIKKVKMKSSEAILVLDVDKIDFLYIDGNHDYEYVKSDLRHYFPLVKHGGIVAGHDWENRWRGVTKAVLEFFGKPPMKKYEDSSWMYIKD